ncbi:hypothetical protein PSTT_02624 [Puccinia striiformis]|uniref:DUS-like FMN-binding domain-containing protein n=1 Tax=Puccinia striiformis TaxID=27350 RepID=A0A2S4VZ15_9BASI|nr:hypothetical protein PSTT_02624 [Puccinia striiformis]
MILAQEFCLSSKARDSDFTTNETERGTFIMEESRSTPATHPSKRKIRGSLIAQFGGNNPLYMGHAAALLKNYVDGIDINCGCPQQWAYKEGIGSALLRKEYVSVNQDRYPSKCVDDNSRTRRQASSHPVNLEGIKFAREEALSSHSNGNGEIPVVANGDIFSLEDANKTREFCGVNGVMSARGLQENPALFSGYDRIPLAGIERFLDLSAQNGFMFPLFHRHLADMLGPWFTSREEKKYFNMLSSPPSVIDFLEETYNIHPSPLPEIIF